MSTKTPEMHFNNFIAPSSWLRFVVAVYPSNEIVGVAEFVLSDMGLAFVGQEDQILFEDGGAERPAYGQFQSRTEILQILELLVRVFDQTGRFHDPRVALGIIQDVGT